MKVFIANFGRGNYEWPKCYERNTVAMMNAEAVHRFWLNGDRESYIKHCIAHIKTPSGRTPTRPVGVSTVVFLNHHIPNAGFCYILGRWKELKNNLPQYS